VEINLKTCTPSPAAIGRAVEQILDSPDYANRANLIAASCAQLNALQSIEQTLESMATG
jgi:UDP:flavonoid glycosyltransferase YjiC (YdhE family)